MIAHRKNIVYRPCPVDACNVLISPNKAMCPTHYRKHPGSAAHLAAIEAACKSLEGRR